MGALMPNLSATLRWRRAEKLCAPATAIAALFAILSGVPARALDGLSKPDKMTTVHYASTGFSWSTAPHLVGAAKGFFKDENLDFQIVVAGQSAAVCQQ